MMTPEGRLARKAARQAERRAARPALQVAPAKGVALFRDIAVMPADAYRRQSFMVNGGPIWPDFASQSLVRMMRRGRHVDEPVERLAGPCARIERRCVWGGYAIAHFGHLIADHLTRVLEARVNRPDDLFLFVVRPGGEAADLPDYVWQVLDWYGLPRTQVHCVTEPIEVAELRCFAQAEPIDSFPPSDNYLALLARNEIEQGLQPDPADVVYVGRPGLLAQGKGGAAGETYLLGVLEQAGVKMLDPLQMTLRDQLAVYAGAKALIFAEGSALHGRQLLGKLDQTIAVLNRRPGARMAELALARRCRALTYVEACRQHVGMRSMGSQNTRVLGLALFDVAAVMDCFATHGIDLRQIWVEADYQAAIRRDAETWLAGLVELGIAAKYDVEEAVRALQAAGVHVDPVQPR